MQDKSNAEQEKNVRASKDVRNHSHDTDDHLASSHAIRYTEARKREVVSYCLGHHPEHLGTHLSAAKVSRMTGINQATISKWIKRFGAGIRSRSIMSKEQIPNKERVAHKESVSHKEHVTHKTHIMPKEVGMGKESGMTRESTEAIVTRLEQEISELSHQVAVMEKVIVNYAIKFTNIGDDAHHGK